MVEKVCSNCGKKYQSKNNRIYNNCFCCKKCESEFRKGKYNGERKYNDILIKDDYALIKINNSTLGEIETLIDIEDIDKVKEYYWNVRIDKRHPNCTLYVESRSNKKRIHLHRVITNCPQNMVVDHIDGNGLNNKKDNLRVCTQAVNCANKLMSNGKYKMGVSYDGRRKLRKYNAYFRGKYLGSFLTENEAHKAYLVEKENYITNYKIESEKEQQNFS